MIAQNGFENIFARIDLQELHKIVDVIWYKKSTTLKFIMYFFMDFFSDMFIKGEAFSIINSAKCVVTNILHILTYPSLNKNPLFMKYRTGILNLSPPKEKLSKAWVLDLLFRYLDK